MSFSLDVKNEIASSKFSQCDQLAQLASLLRIHGDIVLSSNGISIEYHTTNNHVARHVINLVKSLYNETCEIKIKKQVKLKKRDIFIIVITHSSSQIIEELSLLDDIQNIDVLLHKECCKRAFIAGAFLASGSVNDPSGSNYHLEIYTTKENVAEYLSKIMNVFDLNTKVTKRRKGYIAYIKEGEKIADFLRLTNAINQLFIFEDERIKRDFVNSITRVMNMEIANQNKTLLAAKEQLKNISVIENYLNDGQLTKSIKEAILLRKKYPEHSLNELSDVSLETVGKKISKSALNHRFRNIKELAEDLLRSLDDE